MGKQRISDDVKVTLTYKGKSIVVGKNIFAKVKNVLTGGFSEGDVSKPSLGLGDCAACGIELSLAFESRQCKEGFPLCEQCCPCHPGCYRRDSE